MLHLNSKATNIIKAAINYRIQLTSAVLPTIFVYFAILDLWTPAILCPFEITVSALYFAFPPQISKCFTKASIITIILWMRNLDAGRLTAIVLPYIYSSSNRSSVYDAGQISHSFLDLFPFSITSLFIPVESKSLFRGLNLCRVIDTVFCSLSPWGSWKFCYSCLL